MQILVIDESEKKAWRRSRRILAASLYRRGSRTFTGRLSTEGTRDLVSDLKKSASKNTAIVVYKLTAHAEFELIARIGNTKAWGEEGWFAHRVTSKIQTAPEGLSAVERLLRTLLRLAALFHDLGKANALFQAMLRGTAGAQHLRHELVSTLMLQLAWGSLDDPFKALAENPRSVFEPLNKRLADFKIPPEGVQPEFAKHFAEDLLSRTMQPGIKGLLAVIEFLVLTHHRQVDADVQGDGDLEKKLRVLGGHPSLRRHLNVLKDNTKFDQNNLTLAHGELPWENTRWMATVAANAQAVVQLLHNNPGLEIALASNPVAWVKNIALVARPTLIQADHLASALKKPSSAGTSGVFANTCTNARGQNVLADTLSEHLLKTRFAIDPYFKGMTANHKPLPAWAVPKDSLLFAKGPARFQWQDDAAQLLRAIEGIENRPVMALVVSSTGAGKTLGAPKLLAAASANNLRYTCALGLRSLTLQTGAAYRAQLGLTEKECLTVVGDALYAKLASAPDATIGPAMQGSESLEVCDDLVLDGEGTADALANALEFDSMQKSGLAVGKTLAMTEVPVLACTVDHLMGASALNQGTDTRLALRLATADLVLDEIDNYSLEDLQALCRLVHHAACHGRRVVLMSATVSDTVLKALHLAWREGLAVWSLRKQKPVSPVVALVSNQTKSRCVQGAPDAVEAELDAFLAEIGAKLDQEPARTMAKEVVLPENLRSAFQTILDQCIEFARVHHTTNDMDGTKLSTGFARFNQVTQCRQFARFLLEEAVTPPDVDLKVQCYHRRMPLMHLTHIEKVLNALWNRKDEQAIFKHPLVKEWQTAAPVKLILVATTSIQETGRDHDYDFAVTEPWSTRSLVQLAGRVRRHRGGVTTKPNIGVLTQELNQLPGAGRNTSLELGREPLYKGPGNAPGTYAELTRGPTQALAQSHWSRFAKSYPVPTTVLPDASRRSAWLPGEFFTTKGVSAKPCLMAKEGMRAPLPFLEHHAQRLRMNRSGKAGFMSAQDIIGSNGAFVELSWNRHNHVVRFRRSADQMAHLTLDPGTDFKTMVVVERDPISGKVVTRPRHVAGPFPDWRGGTAIKNTHRCLIRTDLLNRLDVEQALGAQAKNNAALRLCHSFEVYLSQDNGSDTQPVDFDPLLGADTKSSQLSD